MNLHPLSTKRQPDEALIGRAVAMARQVLNQSVDGSEAQKAAESILFYVRRSYPQLHHRGVFKWEMPGRDPILQGLNWGEFRRGKGWYPSRCKAGDGSDLTGPALLARFTELTAQNRINGAKSRNGRRATTSLGQVVQWGGEKLTA